MAFTASLGLDWSSFKAGMDGAKSETDKFAQKLNQRGMFAEFEKRTDKIKGAVSNIGANISSGNALGTLTALEGGMAALGPVLGGVAAGAAVVGIAAGGMWSAMNKTRELSNLAAQVQMTIPQLMGLQKAFVKVGVDAEEVPSAIAKMNAFMEEAQNPASKAAQALAKTGVTLEQLNGKTAAEDFKILIGAMNTLTSSTDKASFAREAFGRSAGQKLIPLTVGGLEKAEAKVSPSAQLMQDAAPVFAQFQGKIRELAVSFTPFFVGMAEQVIPTLTEITDKIERLDLTDMGVRFGKAVTDAMEMAVNLAKQIAQITDLAKDKQVGETPYQRAKAMIFGPSNTGPITEKEMAQARKDLSQAKPEVQLPTSGEFLGPSMADFQESQKQAKLAAAKASESGLAVSNLTPIAQPLASSITTSLGKVGGGGNAFLASGVDIPRQQLDEQRKTNNFLQQMINSGRQNLGSTMQTAYIS
jgi:hypothetical protein